MLLPSTLKPLAVSSQNTPQCVRMRACVCVLERERERERSSPQGHIFGHRTCIFVNISFFRLLCCMPPCKWMRWQHNDIGRWQEAAEHEAEHCLVRHAGDALVSVVCPTPHKDVRVSKEEAKQYHSTLPPSMRSELSLTV